MKRVTRAARLGIGVPVFNGGDLLQGSLECLRDQTFEDFEVVIGDNASTDETADICSDFAKRDPRFKHLRRPENIGSLPNFQTLRAQSENPLFCWRAHDDLSAPNFLESLVALLDASPNARLAVCQVRSEDDAKPEPEISKFEAPPQTPRLARIQHQLFSSHACWIYGLWHRETLAVWQDRVHREYPHPWGWDHLTILPMILDGSVVGTNETEFIQRMFRGQRISGKRGTKMDRLSAKKTIRDDYERVARGILFERDWSPEERGALERDFPRYVDRRSYARRKLWRSTWLARLGFGRQSVKSGPSTPL